MLPGLYSIFRLDIAQSYLIESQVSRCTSAQHKSVCPLLFKPSLNLKPLLSDANFLESAHILELTDRPLDGAIENEKTQMWTSLRP